VLFVPVPTLFFFVGVALLTLSFVAFVRAGAAR
jgi:hypothetical protein